MPKEIKEGSVWRHTNGNLYTVLRIANHASNNDRYPLTIVYIGNNGNVWAKTEADWRRSMSEDKRVEVK